MCLHWTLSKRYFVPPHCSVYQTVQAWDLFSSFWLICVELRRWFRLLEQGPSCQGKDMSEALLGVELVFPIPAWQRHSWVSRAKGAFSPHISLSKSSLYILQHSNEHVRTFCVRNVSFSVLFGEDSVSISRWGFYVFCDFPSLFPYISLTGNQFFPPSMIRRANS